MKILITGITRLHCGFTLRLKYVSSVHVLTNCLKQLGHNVECRPVKCGEDLSSYDKVILYLGQFTGFVASFAPGALWTYAQRPDCLISFDDWQVPAAFASIRGLLPRVNSVFEKNQFGYADFEFAKPHFPLLIETLAKLEKDWPNKVLLPCIQDGNLAAFKIPVNPAQLHVYNPVVYFKGWYGWVEEQKPRPKVWVLASLVNNESWIKKQKLKWPIAYFGVKSKQQTRLTEDLIYIHYTNNTGVLSPYHNIDGSGWYRARQSLAADSLSILAGSPSELAMVGESYSFTPTQVEEMNDQDLKDLAALQRYEFYEKAGTKEQLISRINELVFGPV